MTDSRDAYISDLLTELQALFPNLSSVIEQIRGVVEATPVVDSEIFFEPVSLIDITDNRRQLLRIDGETLNAWLKHMAYSTRLRMRALERGILGELTKGNFLSSMVLVRSHMETGALAALCEKTVVESVRSGQLKEIEKLIRSTLFGTALIREASREQAVRELLSWAEQETVTVRAAIDALDKFPEERTARPGLHYLYALLCEFAHPNIRGSKMFLRVLEERSEGWILKYEDYKALREEDLKIALETLLQNMRLGHAAAELIRIGNFVDSPSGFVYMPPSMEDGKRIWLSILHAPDNTNET